MAKASPAQSIQTALVRRRDDHHRTEVNRLTGSVVVTKLLDYGKSVPAQRRQVNQAFGGEDSDVGRAIADPLCALNAEDEKGV